MYVLSRLSIRQAAFLLFIFHSFHSFHNSFHSFKGVFILCLPLPPENKSNMETKEKYLLVAINSGDEDAVWASISELSMLLETAGGEAVDGVVQNLLHPDPATYVGSGKAVELGELVEAYGADGILCGDGCQGTTVSRAGSMHLRLL